MDRIIGIRLKRFFVDRNLRIRAVYFKLSGRGVGPGRGLGFDKPQAEVLEDFFNNLLVLNKTDDPHRAPAFGASERVNLIGFLNQPGPILPIFLFCAMGIAHGEATQAQTHEPQRRDSYPQRCIRNMSESVKKQY